MIDVFLDVCDHGCVTNEKDIVFDFFENIATLQHRPVTTKSWNRLWFDHYKFFGREVFLYWIACLLKRRLYTQASEFLVDQYCYRDGEDREIMSCEVFDNYIYSMDEVRNRRLGLRRMSLVADLIKTRSDHDQIDFDDLIEADLVIFAKPLLSGDHSRWFPRTLVYTTHHDNPTNIFLRLSSARGVTAIQSLFGLANREELIRAFNEGSKKYELKEYRFGPFQIPFASLMGIRE